MTTQVIYRWRSEALKNYGAGHILVVASNVERAREAARQEFPAVIADRWYACGPEDEEYAGYFAALEADIVKEPVIAHAVFIPGSE